MHDQLTKVSAILCFARLGMHGGQYFLTQNPILSLAIGIKKLHSNGRSGDHAIITKYGSFKFWKSLSKKFVKEVSS